MPNVSGTKFSYKKPTYANKGTKKVKPVYANKGTKKVSRKK